MKKFIFLLLSFFILSGIVCAKDVNKFVFKEIDNHMYYETTKFDKNMFIKHDDMLPGTVFEDVLTVDNGTRNDYTLYFKVRKDDLSEEQIELLENINLTILLDDEVLYEGKALGESVESEDWSIDYAIPLGYYEPYKSYEVVVKSELDESYTNTENNSTASFEWVFYATTDLSKWVVSPNTGDPVEKYLTLLIVSITVFILAIIFYFREMDKEKGAE